MLAVIIVSYNTVDLLRGCLASVRESLAGSALPGSLWVVDNASADDSAAMVRAEFPDVHLIANDTNVGFAAANNLVLRALGVGAKSADEKPDAVLLLNPDTEVRGDALARMLDALRDDTRVGVTGASLLYPDGRFQHGAFRFPDLCQIFLDFFPINHRLTNSRLNGRYSRSLYDRGIPFQIDHPLGAALMARWDALEAVGPMDERFFIYCEEIDWCMRFKKADWEVRCVPRAQIVHYAGQSTQQFREKMFVALWESRFLLFEKHYSAAFRRAARILVALGMNHRVRAVRAAVRRGELPPDELSRLEAARNQVMEISRP